ncbi:spore germination protein KB [Orenia metallireducens]|uniref:Spore germination protein KB n=2 Tax=Orenia TaxID=46468 RepID=A0A285ICD8_9FIRM|nr:MULTISPECIES: GerAB/ArcD/ProY family transporter [Orenia]PRX20125.1 spore germination protein KB [Orenia metallireducens]TDX48870.1 spore germination protein KB [Orenia marismortui]SNY45630.1 spore germination protein KB [Orenia metallireducens]
MNYVGKWELFSLTFIFIIGNAGLYSLGVDRAKEDAWLAILLAMFFSYLLVFIYAKLQSLFPESSLSDIIISLLGKKLGIILIILYVMYFIYIIILNFNLHIEFIQIYLLQRSSMVVLFILLMFNMVYMILKGFEVMARVSEIVTVLFIIFLIVIYIMLFFSGAVDFKRLEPVLAGGFKPLWEVAVPELMIFPFGDMVIFLGLWRMVKSKKSILKFSLLGMTLAGLVLSFSIAVMVAVLGAKLAASINIANMALSQMIDVGFIKNTDAVVIIFLLSSGFYKMVLFLYASISLVTDTFKVRKSLITILFALLLLILLYAPFTGVPFHHWIARLDNQTLRKIKYMHVIFQMVIPIILLLIAWFENLIKVK